MFACLINHWSPHNGYLRSSYHQTLEAAIEYAERMPGVVAIEEIGQGIVWQRPEENLNQQ